MTPNELKLVETIYQNFVSPLNESDLNIYRSFKNSDPSLNPIYTQLFDTYSDLIENDDNLNDTSIFEAVLIKLVYE